MVAAHAKGVCLVNPTGVSNAHDLQVNDLVSATGILFSLVGELSGTSMRSTFWEGEKHDFRPWVRTEISVRTRKFL